MKKKKQYKRQRAIMRQAIRADVTKIMAANRRRPKIRAILKARFWAFMARLFVRGPVRVK